MEDNPIIKFKTNKIPLFEISTNPLVYDILQYIKNIEENDIIITQLLNDFNEKINDNNITWGKHYSIFKNTTKEEILKQVEDDFLE